MHAEEAKKHAVMNNQACFSGGEILSLLYEASIQGAPVKLISNNREAISNEISSTGAPCSSLPPTCLINILYVIRHIIGS